MNHPHIYISVVNHVDIFQAAAMFTDTSRQRAPGRGEGLAEPNAGGASSSPDGSDGVRERSRSRGH